MAQPIADPRERGTYIHELWRAWEKRLITWPSVQAASDAVMPRCVTCQTAPMIDSGTGLCGDCFVARMQGAQR